MLCACVFLVIVNSASLSVALPLLVTELDASNSELQWIVAAYSLVFAGLLFPCAAIGDRFGRRGSLQVGVALFCGASVAAALASDASHIIASRGAMGLGAALVIPSSLSTIVSTFSREQQPRAIAIWASVTGIAGSVGPLVSGLLLEHHGFPAVFLLNVPVSIVVLAGSVVLPRSRSESGEGVDVVGALLAATGLSLLVYALIAAPTVGWGSWVTWARLVGALATLVWFVRWELRSRAPMLDVRLFQRPAFAAGTAGMTAAFFAMMGLSVLLSQHFQLIVGLTPFEQAVKFMPTGLALATFSVLSPRVGARLGSRVVAAAGLLMVGTAALVFAVALERTSSIWFLLITFVVLLAGIGLAVPSLTAAVMGEVPVSRPGAGSATNNSTRELGGAVGVAILGSVASSRYADHLSGLNGNGLDRETITQVRTSLARALSEASNLDHDASRRLVVDAQEAFVGGERGASLVAVVVVGLAGALIWRRLPADVEQLSPPSSLEAVADVQGGPAAAAPVLSGTRAPGRSRGRRRSCRDRP